MPKFQYCHNRHLIVRTGQKVKIAPQLLPKGTHHTGVALRPVCSLQGKNLSKGKHQNICELTDPELRTRVKCSYRIHIEESSGPQPHAGDCKNRTVFANRKGSIQSKPVRFLVKVGEPARTRIINGSCKPKGNLPIGTHPILCKATDPYTKVTGTCSYWLRVKEKTCPPLPVIPNARILCDSHTVGAVCRYECDEGYTVDVNHLSRMTKSCHSNVKWQPELDPVCEIKPPKLVEGCDDLEVELSSDESFAVPLPRYLTALNETLNITCTPLSLNAVGYHQVWCTVEDDRFNASCHFNVKIWVESELTTITELPTAQIEQLQLLEGCSDLEVNMSSTFNYTVPVPLFVTASNETPTISCLPANILVAGQHRVNCATENDSFNTSCYFNVTVFERDEEATVLSQDSSCNPLSPPLHGSIQCIQGETESCQVTCDPGYGYSEDNFLTVVCVGSLWDFQESDVNQTLPDCLAQMEGSAVEVWISFEAFAPHCEEELEEQMKDLVNELCQVGTDCSKVAINCTLDEESDMMLMIVNWTVEADFNDEEYYDGEEIPEAEIRLESAMERTHTFLATEDVPGGVHLFRDSFRRGLITLVCPDGFVPNGLMSKCIQCPVEMESCS